MNLFPHSLSLSFLTHSHSHSFSFTHSLSFSLTHFHLLHNDFFVCPTSFKISVIELTLLNENGSMLNLITFNMFLASHLFSQAVTEVAFFDILSKNTTRIWSISAYIRSISTRIRSNTTQIRSISSLIRSISALIRGQSQP